MILPPTEVKTCGSNTKGFCAPTLSPGFLKWGVFQMSHLPFPWEGRVRSPCSVELACKAHLWWAWGESGPPHRLNPSPNSCPHHSDIQMLSKWAVWFRNGFQITILPQEPMYPFSKAYRAGREPHSGMNKGPLF